MAKTVAVWKRVWLPPSETFVRNQTDALRTWRALPFGVARMNSILSRDTDAILFGSSLRDRASLASFRLTGRSRRVEAFLRENDVDVVHAHFGSEAVSIWRQCRHLGMPLVVTLHGHDVTAGPLTPGFEGWRYRRRLRRMFGYASAIIAVSEFIRGQAISLGAPLDRTVVRYIGIPVASSDVSAEADETMWDVAFVGRLSEKKGVMDLLEAIAGMPNGQSVRVAIVGEGPLDATLRAFSEHHGLDIHFLGHRSPAEVRSVLSRARVFVAPSQMAESGDAEGFGLVFLEAALAGLPVVAYRHGGVPEAVVDGETGILVEERDVSGLRDAVCTLLTEAQLAARMGRAGQARVVQSFDIRDRSGEVEQLYDSVAR